MEPVQSAQVEWNAAYCDPLGTPRQLTDAAGVVVWAGEYAAWGAGRGAGGARVAQPLRFPGQYADAETGLHYSRFRYYSPGEGRFINQDPVRLAGGANVSAYVPNPISSVDPYGLDRHITYLGTKNTPSGPKPYAGYAHGPDGLTGEQVLSRRYSGDFSKLTEPPSVLYSGDSKPIARGLEQRSFEQLGGLEGTANKQNPVGPRNANRDVYLQAADDHLANNPSTQRQINAMKPDTEPSVGGGGCGY